MEKESMFSREYDKTQCTIYRPPSNLPELMLNEDYNNFQSYCTLIDKIHHRNPRSIPIYVTTTPEIESRDVSSTFPVHTDIVYNTYIFN